MWQAWTTVEYYVKPCSGNHGKHHTKGKTMPQLTIHGMKQFKNHDT